MRRRSTKHGEVEQASALLDVRLLDVVAEIESLLRDGREIQREALRVRGVPVANTGAQRKAAAKRIVKLVTSMGSSQQMTARLLRDLRACARELQRSVRAARGN